MPLFTQCVNCKRRLRVQDNLIGKTVKCPHCQSVFAAQRMEENGLSPSGPGSTPVISTAEDPNPAPLATPANPEQTAPPKPAVAVIATPLPTPAAAETKPATPSGTPDLSPLKVVGISTAIVLGAASVGFLVGCVVAFLVVK